MAHQESPRSESDALQKTLQNIDDSILDAAKLQEGLNVLQDDLRKANVVIPNGLLEAIIDAKSSIASEDKEQLAKDLDEVRRLTREAIAPAGKPEKDSETKPESGSVAAKTEGVGSKEGAAATDTSTSTEVPPHMSTEDYADFTERLSTVSKETEGLGGLIDTNDREQTTLVSEIQNALGNAHAAFKEKDASGIRISIKKAEEKCRELYALLDAATQKEAGSKKDEVVSPPTERDTTREQETAHTADASPQKERGAARTLAEKAEDTNVDTVAAKRQNFAVEGTLDTVLHSFDVSSQALAEQLSKMPENDEKKKLEMSVAELGEFLRSIVDKPEKPGGFTDQEKSEIARAVEAIHEMAEELLSAPAETATPDAAETTPPKPEDVSVPPPAPESNKNKSAAVRPSSEDLQRLQQHFQPTPTAAGAHTTGKSADDKGVSATAQSGPTSTKETSARAEGGTENASVRTEKDMVRTEIENALQTLSAQDARRSNIDRMWLKNPNASVSDLRRVLHNIQNEDASIAAARERVAAMHTAEQKEISPVGQGKETGEKDAGGSEAGAERTEVLKEIRAMIDGLPDDDPRRAAPLLNEVLESPDTTVERLIEIRENMRASGAAPLKRRPGTEQEPANKEGGRQKAGRGTHNVGPGIPLKGSESKTRGSAPSLRRLEKDKGAEKAPREEGAQYYSAEDLEAQKVKERGPKERVASAANFDELEKVIGTLPNIASGFSQFPGLTNKSGRYGTEGLSWLIDEVKKGAKSVNEIPNDFGIRDKVRQLLAGIATGEVEEPSPEGAAMAARSVSTSESKGPAGSVRPPAISAKLEGTLRAQEQKWRALQEKQRAEATTGVAATKEASPAETYNEKMAKIYSENRKKWNEILATQNKEGSSASVREGTPVPPPSAKSPLSPAQELERQEVEEGKLPNPPLPMTPRLKEELNELFGSKRFLWFGKEAGVESSEWKHLSEQSAIELMDAENEADLAKKYGVRTEDVAPLKQRLFELHQETNIEPRSDEETVETYLKRVFGSYEQK